jgi:PhnB protein
MDPKDRLVPLLVVRAAHDALDFYVRAFGAVEIVRWENEVAGTISHAELAIGGAGFAVTEEAPAWNSDAPPSLGGSPVVLQLLVGDADAAVARAIAAGAETVFPLQYFCGERMARLRDPFGHLWILRQVVEELTVEEKRRLRAELLARTQRAQRTSRP